MNMRNMQNVLVVGYLEFPDEWSTKVVGRSSPRPVSWIYLLPMEE